MALKHFFFPEIIKIPDSKYNKNLTVLINLISNTLISDELIESGYILGRIWKTGLKNLIPKKYKPKSILLLGLAGGSNAHLVNKMYPEAEVTAVEIDQVMIDIGFKYFGLGKVKNMKVITADALKYAEDLTTEHFDIVLVDCFFGQEIPKRLESLKFFENLKNHSTYTLINRLWYKKYLSVSIDFVKTLSTKFQFVSTYTGTNLVISLL